MKIAARIVAVSALTALAACGSSNPFDPEVEETPAEDIPEEEQTEIISIYSDGEAPPGTLSPRASEGITRSEPRGDNAGNVTNYAYDATTDTFAVDNLPFDGDNTFRRDDQVSNLNGYAVYENLRTQIDPDTGVAVDQFSYKALYGARGDNGSGEPTVQFAIVRTGSFEEFGFGGFIFSRSTDVNLPTQLDASYRGPYAGLRTFEGAGGLEYATGDMTIAVDFDDPNRGPAVQGIVDNRRVFNQDGTDATSSILDALSERDGVTYNRLRPLQFVVDANGDLDINGEFSGAVKSSYSGQTFEEGTYYGVIAGDNADELVGVLVVTADEPRRENVRVRETGGFILVRE